MNEPIKFVSSILSFLSTTMRFNYLWFSEKAFYLEIVLRQQLCLQVKEIVWKCFRSNTELIQGKNFHQLQKNLTRYCVTCEIKIELKLTIR